MKYLCIGYFDPAKMRAVPAADVDAAMRECPAHMDTLRQTGRLALVAGAGEGVRYLRLAGGSLAVSADKTETHAQVGCVFLLEAADLEEAVRLAALHPTTQVAAGEALGWYTEVRPVHDFYGGADLLGSPGV